MRRAFGRGLRPYIDKPGVFYVLLLATLCVVQGFSVLAFLRGGELVRAAIPAYTHLLSLTIGTVFLFRGLQLLGSLGWVMLLGSEPPPSPYEPDRAALPIVTVQIPLRNEPLEVAKLAIDSAFALDYPAEKLEVQVIDNSDSEAFIRPVERYLERKTSERIERGRKPTVTFLHREGTRGFKAGNLNLGMSAAKGSFLLILDADSCVPSDTLWATLPYFEDPRLGFVQLRIDSINEDANIITKAAAITTRARFKLMRMRNTQGVVQFDGHNGIFRREALESIGGWVEQISEDLATSVAMVLAGHRGRFVDLPSGELAPARFPELVRQRRRWATGTMYVLKRQSLTILMSSRLRWFEKLDLLFAISNIFIEASTCVLLFTFAPLPAMTVLQIILVFSVLPTYLAGGFDLRKSLLRQASVIFVISAILPALVQGTMAGLLGRRHSFAVTRKVGEARLRFPELLGRNVFGFSIAIVFFVVAMSQARGLAVFFDSYLAGTIIMGSVLTAPFALNYSRTLMGARRR